MAGGELLNGAIAGAGVLCPGSSTDTDGTDANDTDTNGTDTNSADTNGTRAGDGAELAG